MPIRCRRRRRPRSRAARRSASAVQRRQTTRADCARCARVPSRRRASRAPEGRHRIARRIACTGQARRPRDRDRNHRLRRRSSAPPPAIRRARAPDRRIAGRSRARSATSRWPFGADHRRECGAQAGRPRRSRSRSPAARSAGASCRDGSLAAVAAAAMRNAGLRDVMCGRGYRKVKIIFQPHGLHRRDRQSVPNPLLAADGHNPLQTRRVQTTPLWLESLLLRMLESP